MIAIIKDHEQQYYIYMDEEGCNDNCFGSYGVHSYTCGPVM